MTRKRRRTVFLAASLACFAFAAALVLAALEDKVTFFYSPSDLAAASVGPETRIRLGGLVVDGSVARPGDGIAVVFELTDGAASIPVSYTGVLPDLFREGQGIVAAGRLVGGSGDGADAVFMADEVLAKHDETYMPPEVAEALRKTGHWREDRPR